MSKQSGCGNSQPHTHRVDRWVRASGLCCCDQSRASKFVAHSQTAEAAALAAFTKPYVFEYVTQPTRGVIKTFSAAKLLCVLSSEALYLSRPNSLHPIEWSTSVDKDFGVRYLAIPYLDTDSQVTSLDCQLHGFLPLLATHT